MPEDTFEAQVTQFIRPNGRQERHTTALPAQFKPDYDAMLYASCQLESEVLGNGMVSVTISNDEEDVDIEIVPNGHQVQQAMCRMLARRRWGRLAPEVGHG